MKIHCPYDRLVAISDLKHHPKNRNNHTHQQEERLAEILKYQGWRYPIKVSNQSGFITSGHGRLLAAQRNEWTEVPVSFQDYESEEQEYADLIADNAIAAWSELDLATINCDIADLGPDFNIDLLGLKDFAIDLNEKEPDKETKGNLSEKFLIPPFSVWNAREGWWQDRKRSWIAMGIESEQGRANDLLGFSKTATLLKKVKGQEAPVQSGTSIFDPVICEIIYRWFCPSEGLILDPFAGGSVRGIVASKLNRQYIGNDLRPEQIESNRAQADKVCVDPMPVWHCGDSRDIATICKDIEADLIFSCPPYADLEVYSDNPKDLSTLDYAEFRAAYFDIIKESVKLLKNNRFACFVVGEVRQKKNNGIYLNFVADTIAAFEGAGANFYNEAILVTAVGTLALRAGKAFSASRKLGKTHQNVLIFVKGDAKLATQACGEIKIDEDLLKSAVDAREEL
jgi:hypothetical protein